MPRKYSERELNLRPRWFTGKEWADGTAERESRKEYQDAIDRKLMDEMDAKKGWKPAWR